MTDIGPLVEQLRKGICAFLLKHGLTAYQLASLAKLDNSRVYRFVKGMTKKAPSPDFCAVLLSVGAMDRPFWTPEINTLLIEVRDYYLNLGI